MDLQKNNVLVLPDLFPKNDKDWVGVFVVDYIKAILPHTTPWVFYSRLSGGDQVAKKERFDGEFDVYRWSYKKQINKLLKPIFYLLWFKSTVNQILSLKKKVDLIHSHGAILNGTVAYLLSKKLQVPFVITEHTNPLSKISDSFVKRNWATFILNRADKIFAVSNHLKNEMIAMGIKDEAIEVSFNPIATDLFKAKKTISKNNRILFVSRLEPYKGGLRSLKGFHLLMSKTKEWHLTICGEGYEKKVIVEYINEFELQDFVTLKGVLTKPEYARELHMADFLIFPSLHESFGLIPVEAMACGLPVIATNATAMPEYINENNGILLQTSAPEEIRDAMFSMIQGFYKYDSAGISKEMVDRFGMENFGKMLLRNYKSAMENYQT